MLPLELLTPQVDLMSPRTADLSLPCPLSVDNVIGSLHLADREKPGA